MQNGRFPSCGQAHLLHWVKGRRSQYPVGVTFCATALLNSSSLYVGRIPFSSLLRPFWLPYPPTPHPSFPFFELRVQYFLILSKIHIYGFNGGTYWEPDPAVNGERSKPG